MDCRIYVCKSYFGSLPTDCIRFKNEQEYKNWLNSSNTEGYTFQPVCNCKEVFDKMILMYRSGKLSDIKMH